MKKTSRLLAATTEQGITVTLDENITKSEVKNWKAAESLIIEYEEQKGWKAERVSNCGYDIKSIKLGEERHIEVKSKDGKSRKFGWTELSANEAKQFWSDPNYWVYLVEGDCNNPYASIDIIELDWEQLKARSLRIEVVRFRRLGSLARKSFKRKQ